MWPPRSALTSRHLAALSGAIVLAGALAGTAGLASATAAASTTSTTPKSTAAGEFVAMAATGSIKVYWRGNGHGHGMSQYGARGAAIKGLSASKILAFYYPGTTLTTIAPKTIRVRLTDTTTADTTVFAGTPGLTLTGYGALPKTGYRYFRLTPSGTGLRLQGQQSGASGSWHTLKTGLPKRADFSTAAGWVQVLMYDGSSTRYHGTVGAVRDGASEWTINRVAMDLYVQGSVPREMPASWQAAAVRAQAVAARSYAEAELAAAGTGSLYDICDTTMCQSYGGMAHYDSTGHLLWSDDPAALINNANKVLHYKGGPVFAQYSASNGGATVDGGQPYLIGKSDPYDTAASGDPYLDESTSVPAASLASSFGLKTVTSVQVTKRDGYGPWGGRIEAGYVNGTTPSGKSAHVAATGFDLGNAAGVGTDYLRFASELSVASAPRKVRAVAGDAGATVSWTAPTNTGNVPITSYRLTFAGHTISRAATTRSTWVGPLSNLAATTVTVQALNSVGASAPTSVAVTARASPQPIVAVTPKQVLSATATSTDPYRFSVPGHGAIPKTGATSVQLAVTVHAPSASGVLSVVPSGLSAAPLAALAYRAGRTSTVTVSVPLAPYGTIVFRPSAGTLRVTAVEESYTAASGTGINVTGRQRVGTVANVPTGNGAVLSLDGLSGITAATKGVVVAVDATSPRSTTLRLWPDGTARPVAAHVIVSRYTSKTNVVILPISAAHKVRIAASAAGVRARLTLLGTLDPSGGRLETFPASPLIDDGSTTPSRKIGTTPAGVAVSGSAQIPTSGVSAVLLQVTVRSAGSAGHLWAYPDGRNRVSMPVVTAFPSSGSVTSIALVRLGGESRVMLKSSVAAVHVSLDAIGYVTAP
jgi:peptidoglycan hydrolase-like amidase